MTQRQKFNDLLTVLLTESIANVRWVGWAKQNGLIKPRADSTWCLTPKGIKRLERQNNFYQRIDNAQTSKTK